MAGEGKIIYDSPIGPMPKTGMPMGSLLGNSMAGLSGVPIPNLTGGAAAPSAAATGDIRNMIYATSGGGGMFWLAMFGIVGLLVWKSTRKK